GAGSRCDGRGRRDRGATRGGVPRGMHGVAGVPRRAAYERRGFRGSGRRLIAAARSSSAQSALSQKSTGFQADTRFRAEQESAVLRVRQTDRGSGSSALSEAITSRRPQGAAKPGEIVPLLEKGAFAILCL